MLINYFLLAGVDETSGVVSGPVTQLSRRAKRTAILSTADSLDPLHSRLLKGWESPLPEHP